MKGAGGTTGGIKAFFIGFIMMVAGGYLFLNSVQVTSHFNFGFGFGRAFSSFGGFSTSGYVFIPFMFGVGMIFFNSRNFLGWLLMLASTVMLVFGVITSLNIRLRSMSAFELISIIVLMIGGLGMFLRSLKSLPTEEEINRKIDKY